MKTYVIKDRAGNEFGHFESYGYALNAIDANVKTLLFTRGIDIDKICYLEPVYREIISKIIKDYTSSYIIEGVLK